MTDLATAHTPVSVAQPIRRTADRTATRPARSDVFEGTSWTVLAMVTDAIVLWAAALTATHITHRVEMLTVVLLGGLALVGMGRMATRGMYGARPLRMSVLDTVRDVVVAVGGAGIAALALAAIVHAGRASTDALAWAWLLGGAGLVTMRVALVLTRDHARRRGTSGKRALIVGAGLVGAQLERRLLARPSLGLEPVGFLDSNPGPAFWDEHPRSPVLGAPDALADVVAATGAEHVIVAFSSAPDSTVQPILSQCERLGIEVSVVPRLFENASHRQWVEHVGGLPLVGMRMVDPRSWQFGIKHAMDRTLATMLLLIVSPIMLAAAIAVKLSSPGAILFRQRRIGRDGRAFEMYKFRSMREEPDIGPALEADSAPGGVEGIDRRTTVGTFLRRTAIDELPQLLNVAFGHMSLVGPRPERPEFVRLFDTQVHRYDDRHRVKSGMTGWAQVHGLRGQTSLSERVEWDNWYIQNWSLWLDLKILLMTPFEVLRSRSEAGR